jgi:serine protease
VRKTVAALLVAGSLTACGDLGEPHPAAGGGHGYGYYGDPGWQGLWLTSRFPPNDPDYAWQRWHFEQIELTQALRLIRQIRPVPQRRPIVAIIDSGVVLDHPDLVRQLVAGFDFVAMDFEPDDVSVNPDWSFHGTMVAGIVAAETFNGAFGAGTAPMALLMPLRTGGDWGFSERQVIQAIRFAAGLANDSGDLPVQRADVISVSLGRRAACSLDYQAAIAAARAQGSVVVVAAGNDIETPFDPPAPLRSPASCPAVIAVGATTPDRTRAYYSNVGQNLSLMAPGGDDYIGVYSTSAYLLGTLRSPGMGEASGTSLAAPHVAGVIALMRFVNPDLTPDQIDTMLHEGRLSHDMGTPGHDRETGYGLVSAKKAVEAALASRTSGAWDRRREAHTWRGFE